MKLKWRYPTKLNDFYTTNDVEGVNNKLKELSRNKKMNLSDLFVFFEDIFRKQKNDSILSMRGLGIYLVTKEYNNFIYSAKDWSSLEENTQIKKIKNFFKKRIVEKEDDAPITIQLTLKNQNLSFLKEKQLLFKRKTIAFKKINE